MKKTDIAFADATEYAEIGSLMAAVYASLEGFPSRQEQPDYYTLFDNLDTLAGNEKTDIITARTNDGELLGCVVYFSDMAFYGSGGLATAIENASGFRLLAVHGSARGQGVGRALTERCIELAQSNKHNKVVIHTTRYMKTAWGLYERMGFKRFESIDFKQGELPVFGFKLELLPNLQPG